MRAVHGGEKSPTDFIGFFPAVAASMLVEAPMLGAEDGPSTAPASEELKLRVPVGSFQSLSKYFLTAAHHFNNH
jgi:hypothetical protein